MTHIQMLVDYVNGGEEEEGVESYEVDRTTTLEANDYWVERFANTLKQMEKKKGKKGTK